MGAKHFVKLFTSSGSSLQIIFFTIFATAKTHKFDDYSSINANNLRLRPITDQSNTFTYNAAKIVSDYLQPLAQNEYVIKDEEYVLHDVESLFTSIREQSY